ncbi:MAG: isopenicillin N synthase family oxygenase [Bacteroidia bacterium]|nr:isopenicillin N synthase family oxygenase [Bacteroidia bacterium]
MSLEKIPTVDVQDFISGDPERKAKFVKALGDSFSNIGFALVSNHSLTSELRDGLFHAVKEFFALPDEVKQKYEEVELGGQRGYTSKGREKAKGFNTPDLKEFYHVGQEVTDGDPIKDEYPDNMWPDETPALKEYGLAVYKRFELVGARLLQATALYLGLDEHYFDDKIHNGNSILRPIHYFPISDPDSVPEDAVRAAAHEDINLISLLMGASAEGLEVLRADGTWLAANPTPDQLVINVGDMLQRLTNNRLKSTTHRVANPPREKLNTPRYSIPFFLHPKATMDLTCLESCIDAEHPKAYPDTTAGEFLNERLREIGLLKK